MAPKYRSFEDLPTEVAERFKNQIVKGEERQYPSISKDASMDEIMLAGTAYQETLKNPNYTEKQLEKIVDAFTILNTAVKKGLPNQLYQMIVKTIDPVISKKAYESHAIWYAHEDGDYAKDRVQEFADEVKAKIDERKDWDLKQFHMEYLLVSDFLSRDYLDKDSRYNDHLDNNPLDSNPLDDDFLDSDYFDSNPLDDDFLDSDSFDSDPLDDDFSDDNPFDSE